MIKDLVFKDELNWWSNDWFWHLNVKFYDGGIELWTVIWKYTVITVFLVIHD